AQAANVVLESGADQDWMVSIVPIVVLFGTVDIEALLQDVEVGHHLAIDELDSIQKRRRLRIEAVPALQVHAFAFADVDKQRSGSELHLPARDVRTEPNNACVGSVCRFRRVE